MQKKHATGSQSHTICSRMAASRIQFVQGWPPVACNTSKNGGHLPATGGHPGIIWMRLAATRQRNSGRLAASRMHAGGGAVAASRRQILHALAASTCKVANFLQARCDNNYLNLKMKKPLKNLSLYAVRELFSAYPTVPHSA